MAAKKTLTTLKLTLKAAEATPAPPVGSALGQHGVNIMEFVKAYNDRTAEMKGQIVPAVISSMIKSELKLEKGSGTTPKDTVGTLTSSQVEKIVKEKLVDLNTDDLEAAKKIIVGTAKSMGVKIEN